MNLTEKTKLLYLALALVSLTLFGVSYSLYQSRTELSQLKQNQKVSFTLPQDLQKDNFWGDKDWMNRDFEQQFEDFHKNMNEMVSSFFKDNPFFIHNGIGVSSFTPTIGINEKDDQVEVVVNIPESKDMEFNAEIKDNSLIIHGKSLSTNEETNKNVYSQKSYSNHFSQTVTLPENVDAGKMKVDNKGDHFVVVIPKLS